MVQSKLLDNFRIRIPEEGYVNLSKHIKKWQIKYLDQKDDTQVHFDIKGRQVGLSNFYKFLAMYYFLFDTSSFNITYYTPTYSMQDPRLIHRNCGMMDIELTKNNQRKIQRPNGSTIYFKTLNKPIHFGNEDIIFVDEIFHIDNIRENIEILVDYVLRDPTRKLFIGGSLSTDFGEDAKLVKHINKVPVEISRNFIIYKNLNMKLDRFLSFRTSDVMYEFRPDVLFDILEEDYSDKFEVLS